MITQKPFYINLEFTIGMNATMGGYLSPKLRFDETDVDTDTEDKVVARAIEMIRDNFAAARRLQRLQGK